MRKPVVSVLILVSCFTVVAFPVFGQTAPADRPNVVLFLADDLGWNDVGYLGSEIRTPNIDKLASQGVQLDRFYAYPLCTPTRVALMTGRNANSLGVYGPFAPTLKGGLPLDEHLLPQTFKDAGYQTFMTGKWHLGNSHVDYFPHSRGFDRFYGHLGPEVGYFTHLIEGGVDWQRNGKTVREEGYTTELIGKEAARLLRERDKNKPVFLYVSFNAPHVPLQAPQEYIDKYAAIADENRRVFAAMVDAMDHEIGRVLTAIEQEEMKENTLVVFLSDNGGNINAGASNTPLNGSKGSVYEGGIRTPGAVHWPGVIEGGRKIDQMITVHDMLPTLAAAVGIKPGNEKPLYGRNMWPAIREGTKTLREHIVFGARGNYAAFEGEWKLVQITAGEETTTRLYRIREDPNEKDDLTGSHPDVAARLTARIDQLPKGENISGPDGRRGEAGRGRQGGAGNPAGARGRRRADPTAPPETRKPYAEAAARD